VPTAIADADNTQFQTYTVVCSFDESARAQLDLDPANGAANVNLCIFEDAFVYKGRWLAVATWSAATFHIKDRDQFIGWTPEQCCRRRLLLANNSRLLAS
jgi:hypothetical protein